MKTKLRKITSVCLAVIMILGVLTIAPISVSAANNAQDYVSDAKTVHATSQLPTITYKAHVQNIGWMSKVFAGETSGTTGKGLRLEAFSVNLFDEQGNSMIKYSAHVQDIGWQKNVSSGEVSGTVGKSKRIEAVKISLVAPYDEKYDIWYRLHVADYGWLGWAKNGETAGSVGMSIQSEAIEIKLLEKNTSFNPNGNAMLKIPSLTYTAHSQNKGWMSSVNAGSTAGTTGEGLRLEALKISLSDMLGGNGIQYRAHVSDIGWQSWKSSGQTAGTIGQSKQIEAVQIKLTDTLSKYFDISYRLHVKNYGWLGWTKNGAYAGTVGGGLQAEAIQIVLSTKNNGPTDSKTAFKDLSSSNTGSSASSTYDQKVSAFLNDSRWRNGASYNSSRRPYISSYSSSGCCAYCADFVQYVYGKSLNAGSKFYNPSEIKSGDVIKVDGSQHWFVVLYRNGNQLITAEGNWTGGCVCYSTSSYTVSGNTLMRNGNKFRTFSFGYHYM